MNIQLYLLVIILIISTGIYVSGDSSIDTPIAHINSSTNVSDDSSFMDDAYNQTQGLIPNETKVIGMKAPRSSLIFMSGVNSTSNITENYTSLGKDSGESINQSANLSVNTSLEKYDSLGDIIKAKDWKALGEYQCRMKTDYKSLLDDSDLNTGDQEAKWNGYFNYREPVVISYPCCG